MSEQVHCVAILEVPIDLEVFVAMTRHLESWDFL